LANVQAEDGHIRIANNLWEALMGAGLNRNEYRATLCILRYSYGVKQHYAKLKKKEIAGITRIPLQKVNETLTSLEKKNIIRMSENNGYIYFHKDYEKWQLHETLTLDEKWRAQVHETLTKNLTKREVIGSRNVKFEPSGLAPTEKHRAPKTRFKTSVKERTTIMSQINSLLSQFPLEIKDMVNEYVELAKMQNKTERISLQKKRRLINELYVVYSSCNHSTLVDDFKKALRITINNEAPHINYVRKVMDGIMRKRAVRLKRGRE